MSRRVTTCIGLAILVIVVVVLFAKREPSIRGKTLSQWGQQYGTTWAGNREAHHQAELAILDFGTNAIPFYIEFLHFTESPIKTKLREFAPAKWQTNKFLRDTSHDIRGIGAYGLAALGTNGGPAIPRLIELARTSPNENVRYLAVFALRTFGIASEPATPFFIECLTNKSEIVADEGVLALGMMHVHPETAVPALTQYLKSYNGSSHTFQCIDAIQALGFFRTNAISASPLVASFLTNSDQNIREAVSNYLPNIDPFAAEKLQLTPARWSRQPR